MVSISKHKHHNERLVRFFLEKAYPDKIPSIDDLIRDNVISGTQLSEIAVSNATGIEIHSEGIGQDLVDGSDIKTGVVIDDISNRTRYLPVQHISGKTGKLRIIGWNPFHDEWVYFVIPCPRQKTLKISFSRETGTPQGKYAKFQIFSWQEFCRC